MAPVVLVEVGGVILAIVLARRRFAPALCVILALGAMLVVGVGSMIARETPMAGVYRGDRWFEDIRPAMIAIDIAATAAHTGGVALLIVAALGWRPRHAPVDAGPPPSPARETGTATTAEPRPTSAAAPAPPSASYSAAPPPTGRISKGLYLTCLYAGPFVSLLLVAPAFVALAQRDEDLVPFAFVFICAAYVPIILATVMAYVLLFKLWSTIRDGDVRTTPGRAVGFCFIPFFNLYWIFQAIYGWSVDFNRYTREHGIRAPRAMEGLGLTLCVMSLLMIVPYLNVLLALAMVIPAFIYHNRAIGCANAVRDWRGGAPPAPP